MALELTRTTTLSKDVLLKLYQQMVEIRRCEEGLARAHQAGLVLGACHTYVAEEAIASGISAHLRTDDVVLNDYVLSVDRGGNDHYYNNAGGNQRMLPARR